jgi:CTP:molybdopterin cytidylyltransferase MocA
VTGVLVQSVDQPAPTSVLDALFTRLEAALGDAPSTPPAVIVPVYGSRRGHPILLAGHLVPELRAVDEATAGLRAVVQRHAAEVVEVPVDNASVTWNLNDPAAYAAARAAAAQ